MVDPEDPELITTKIFEQSLADLKEQNYILRLYIAGTTLQSVKALRNIKKICEDHLQGRYELEVIDIYQQAESLASENIVAVPTLIKELPLPLQKMIGNLSNTEKVLIGLDILPKGSLHITGEKDDGKLSSSS